MLGYVLSAYCVYKMFTSFKALLVGEDFSSDSVGRLLAALLWRGLRGTVDIDVAVTSQYVTLLLVGVLSVMSIRGFMMQVTHCE